MLKEKVVVIGGGVGGLTAAHELVERDFEVHVYERREYFGGKAASTRDKNNYPREHGFRFFPSWYRHLPDTLERIPYRGDRPFKDAKTVADNLIRIDQELLAWYQREPLTLLTHVPRTVDQAKTAAAFVSQLAGLGLSALEVAFFARKMLEFLVTPDAQRAAKWESITWWEYLEADTKSQAYQDLIGATTRLMVAAKAHQVSAYTIGRLVLRTLSDALTTVDRVLDGPTNETWIDPWVAYLEGSGTEFHRGWELDSIAFYDGDGSAGRVAPRLAAQSARAISHVFFSRVVVQHVGTLRTLLPILATSFDKGSDCTENEAAEATRAITSCRALLEAILEDRSWQGYRKWREKRQDVADSFDAVDGVLKALELCLPPAEEESAEQPPEGNEFEDHEFETRERRPKERDKATTPRPRAVITEERLENLIRSLGNIGKLKPDLKQEADQIPLLLRLEDVRRRLSQSPTATTVLEFAGHVLATMSASPFAALRKVSAQYFVFALPVEQMAYYVNRSAAMTTHDPSLYRIVPLSQSTDWMSGIQFYLREACNLVEGHLVCMDSEWSLTAIEQTQFWRDARLKLSVPPGVEQTPKAILSVDVSTWDRPGRFVQLEAFNCTREEIATEVWNELKASVSRLTKTVRLRDDMLLGGPTLRSGVNFHLDASVADVYDRKKQANYERARAVEVEADAETRLELPYIWGACRDFNAEPLLLNRAGTRALRPDAGSAIPNMFLAADYVHTETDLACMEGANEAARRAVNALLHAAGSLHEPCRVWPFSVTRDVLERLTQLERMGEVLGLATQAARTAGRVTDTLLGVAGQAVSNFRSTRSGNAKR